MTRRGLLAVLAAACTSVLGACTGRSEDDRLATVDREVVSPSGEHSAIVSADGDELHPMILDSTGTPVWTDDLPHVDRYFPGVVWEAEDDVLWILSTDHGNGSVRQEADGDWTKTMGSDGMPEEIAERAR